MVNSLQLFCEISGLSEIDFSRVSGYRSATSLNTHKNESKFNYIDVIRFAQEAVKRLVQKRKIITQEESLKHKKMPLKKGKSKKVISSNVKELLHNYKKKGTIGTSRPKSIKQAQKQAAAIAYSKARKK